VIAGQMAAKDRGGITGRVPAILQTWDNLLTRWDTRTTLCARRDLNRARPTLVMPNSANLSVK
jgi:hypothetical protein